MLLPRDNHDLVSIDNHRLVQTYNICFVPTDNLILMVIYNLGLLPTDNIGLVPKGNLGLVQTYNLDLVPKGNLGLVQTYNLDLMPKDNLDLVQTYNLDLMPKDNLGLVQTYNHDLMQADNLGLMQTFNHDLVQANYLGLVQTYNLRMVQADNLSMVQTYNHDLMQAYNLGMVQTYNLSMVQADNIGMVQSYNHDLVQADTLGMLQTYNHDLVQADNLGLVQTYNHDLVQADNLTMVQTYNLSMVQADNFSIMPKGNLGMVQADNLGMVRTYNHDLVTKDNLGLGQADNLGMVQTYNLGLVQANNIGLVQADYLGLVPIDNLFLVLTDNLGLLQTDSICFMPTDNLILMVIDNLGLLPTNNHGLVPKGNLGMVQADNIGLLKTYHLVSNEDIKTKADSRCNTNEIREEVEFPPEFTCPVCKDLLYRPHRCDPCNHIFCEHCLKQIRRRKSFKTPCPLCRVIICKCYLEPGIIFRINSEYANEIKKRGHEIRREPYPLPSFSWERYERFLAQRRSNNVQSRFNCKTMILILFWIFLLYLINHFLLTYLCDWSVFHTNEIQYNNLAMCCMTLNSQCFWFAVPTLVWICFVIMAYFCPQNITQRGFHYVQTRFDFKRNILILIWSCLFYLNHILLTYIIESSAFSSKEIQYKSWIMLCLTLMRQCFWFVGPKLAWIIFVPYLCLPFIIYTQGCPTRLFYFLALILNQLFVFHSWMSLLLEIGIYHSIPEET